MGRAGQGWLVRGGARGEGWGRLGPLLHWMAVHFAAGREKRAGTRLENVDRLAQQEQPPKWSPTGHYENIQDADCLAPEASAC